MAGFRQNVGKSASCLWGPGKFCRISDAWDLIVSGARGRILSLLGEGQLEAKQF